MEHTGEIGANLLMLLIFFVGFCIYRFIKWIKFHFIFCKHKEEDREYYGDYSFGFLGSKFQKFKCTKCGRKFEAQNKTIISKVA